MPDGLTSMSTWAASSGLGRWVKKIKRHDVGQVGKEGWIWEKLGRGWRVNTIKI